MLVPELSEVTSTIGLWLYRPSGLSQFSHDHDELSTLNRPMLPTIPGTAEHGAPLASNI